MDFLYSFFFAAGVSGIAYTKFGRRLGYGNAQAVWIMVGVVFVIMLAVFYTITRFFLESN